MLVQATVAAVGVWVAAQLPPGRGRSADAPVPARSSLWAELGAGLSLIASTPVLRATYLVTLGMGIFFGGMFLVIMPLAVTDWMESCRKTHVHLDSRPDGQCD